MEQLKIRIKRNDKSYQVFIGTPISSLIRGFLEKRYNGKKIVVVTDSNVKEICKNSVLEPLKELNPALISIPAGESSKSRETKEKIEDMLLEKKYGRDTVMLAVGGGVIGDLAGFTAATYERGIPLIHVPTTLLAMVDSSIGGKTAVNTKHGKNLIGSIYHPDAVFADLSFLEALPAEEFANGLAEITKIASTSDKELFSFLEKNKGKIIRKDKKVLLHIIRRSIELKKEVVEKDEKEQGLRQILNFGHTFGHAFELHKNYEARHGHCVSMGINVESKISELAGKLKDKDRKRILSLLESFGLPTKIEDNIDTEKIIDIMKIDKKSISQKPRFVVLESIGRIKSKNNIFSFDMDESTIKNAIELCKND